MSGLKLNGLDKIYPSGSVALYNINLETQDKEFFVIVGGEASGKTSLLRIIAGLDDPTAGSISIGGKDVTEADPKERDVALVFRDSALKNDATVFENLAYGLKIRKAPQVLIDQRVKAAAKILGLENSLNRKTKLLSSAEKQRVAIGRAIVREPKLYLFDEPLSGLDDKLKGELLNVIINLQARMEGTFVYATKNVAEAMTIGTRIAVIKNGIIQQVDIPANLYDYPANQYVAFMIGSPTVNFINKAVITKNGDGIFAEAGGVKLNVPENILKRFENLDEYANTGKTVIIGIRPEDAEISNEGLDVKVEKTENGFTQCDLCGNPLTVKQGKGGKVKIDLTRLYLFDEETRLTLLARDEGYVKTQFAEADVVPLTFGEQEKVKEKYKPAKTAKRK